MGKMDLFERLAKERKLSAQLIHLFEKEYGNLFYKSLEFIQKAGPKVYKVSFSPSNLDLWTVQGAKRTYLVYPNIFCQCQDFLLNSIYRRHKFYMCKHLFAQKLADSLDQYITLNLKDKNFGDWKKQI